MENKTWTTDDVDYLIENYKNIDIEELAIRLGRSINSIRLKAVELKISVAKKEEYSKEEDRYILDNHRILSIQEIADNLGRTKSAVNKRLFKIRSREMKVFRESFVEIEDNITFDNNMSESYKIALDKLEISQSFVFEKKHYQTIRNQTILLNPKKFATKKIDKETSRLWRIC